MHEPSPPASSVLAGRGRVSRGTGGDAEIDALQYAASKGIVVDRSVGGDERCHGVEENRGEDADGRVHG
jgi:hypothetical protein